MVDEPNGESTIFEMARAAARDCVDSILEIARRTNTPVIVYRNGKIEHLSPDDFPEHAKAARGQEGTGSLRDFTSHVDQD